MIFDGKPSIGVPLAEKCMWSSCDPVFWASDLKIYSVSSCSHLYRICKFDEIPISSLRDIVLTNVVYDHSTHMHFLRCTAKIRMPAAANSWQKHKMTWKYSLYNAKNDKNMTKKTKCS